MSSYLEEYGAGEEQRAKRLRRIKRGSIAALLALIVAVVIFAVFKNYPEQQQAESFLEDLRKQDYQAAYRMFGCTETNPCRDYTFQKFMDDWGPKSAHADSTSAHIGMSQSCGTGVILRIDYKGAEPVPLWVERSTHLVSFAPDPECRGRHLHVGAFLRSLFTR
jgi:hypothetical protein